MKKINLLIAGLALGWLSSAAGARMARAEEATLWQIGQFDDSSEEFGTSFSVTPTSVPQDAVYRVGVSDWKKDWPGFHPGSANGQAGGREHPFTVIFSLDELPRGLYTLTVSTLHYTPRRPNLRVDLNGKQGLFYFRPRVSYDRGNFPVAFIPHYAFQKLDIGLSPAYFKKGDNRLVLTSVDDPTEPDQAIGSAAPGVSGIYYDALRLTQDKAKKFAAGEIRVSVTPTVFYRQRAGSLVELVEVIVGLNQKVASGQVSLEMNGRRDTGHFSAATDFGEQRVELEVPEWSGPANALLRVKAWSARTSRVVLEPQRKWTVFVAPHVHLDVGYTDYQGKVAEIQPRLISQAAELIRGNADFRFSIDGSWSVEQFLQSRSKEKQNELLELVRAGKLAVPAQYFNLLTGYASLETLFRSLYYSKALARQYGIPFEFANITDVPSYSGSYPSVLASAGVKYFAAAGNNWRAPFLLYGLWNEKSPFWWVGPDGKKVLCWYSRHYMQVQSLFGLPPRMAAIRDSLPVFLQAYSRPDYKPDVVLIHGTQVENTELYPEQATFAREWNTEYAYPRLRYATFGEFLKFLDEQYGSKLETYRGDGGPYWEDGVASDATFVAEDRRNQNRALTAETLSTLTYLLNPESHAPKNLVDDVWRNILLFAEHTWGAWISMSMPDHAQTVKQLEVKDHYVTEARLKIDELLERAMSRLAEQIHVPSSTLVVFNSLNWRRNDLVELDLLGEDAAIQDLSTKQNVSYEVLSRKQGYLRVRFLGEDLPPVGYKCFAIRYGGRRNTAPASPGITRESVIENAFYRLTLDPASGAVSSIYDQELKREIVDGRSPYKFNQYLYVTGGDGQTQIMRPIKAWPVAELTLHPATGGAILGVSKTPFGHSIRLRSSAPNTPSVQTEILLFDKEKKIEFLNRVEKQAVLNKEGVYFAFPVAVENPEFVYAIQTGWVNPARDLLRGASLEWFNVQHWMAVRDPQLTVGVLPLDVPLASFGDVNRGLWPAEFRPKSSTIFSYVMNNYWDTNYRASQGGPGVFRYVVTSGRSFEAEALARLGWNHMRPVEINLVMGQEKVGNPPRRLPPEGASFLEVDQPNVVLLTWKRAEDGQGTILRLYETGGRETATTLRFLHRRLQAASLCNAVEDNIRSLSTEDSSLRVNLHAHEVVTLRVQ